MSGVFARLRGDTAMDHAGTGVGLFLGGVGLGAALVYFLDPKGGAQRRALVRDKALEAAREAREGLQRATQDLATRARGTVDQVKGRLAEVQERIKETPGAIPSPPTTFKS